MTTYTNFLKLYAEKSKDLGDIRVCSVCGETHASFIDATNPIDVTFLCYAHWREKDRQKDMESRETAARHA